MFTIRKFISLRPETIPEDLANAVADLDLIELLRASPSPTHWHLADKLELRNR